MNYSFPHPQYLTGITARKIRPKLMNKSASSLIFTLARSIATINFLCYASNIGWLGCTAADNN